MCDPSSVHRHLRVNQRTELVDGFQRDGVDQNGRHLTHLIQRGNAGGFGVDTEYQLHRFPFIAAHPKMCGAGLGSFLFGNVVVHTVEYEFRPCNAVCFHFLLAAADVRRGALATGGPHQKCFKGIVR